MTQRMRRRSTPSRMSSDALVLAHVGDVERQRLVVDVDAHDLRVGRVDDRLADLGEAVRLLGVADRERLVEPVDERAVLVREATLGVVAAQAEVAVADREERLGHPDVVEVERRLDEAPRVDGEPVAIDHADCSSVSGVGTGRLDDSREVVDDDVGAGVAQRLRAGAAVDADDEPEAAGGGGLHAAQGVFDGDAARGVDPQHPRAPRRTRPARAWRRGGRARRSRRP